MFFSLAMALAGSKGPVMEQVQSLLICHLGNLNNLKSYYGAWETLIVCTGRQRWGSHYRGLGVCLCKTRLCNTAAPPCPTHFYPAPPVNMHYT